MKQILFYTAIGFAIGLSYLKFSNGDEFDKRFPLFSSNSGSKNELILNTGQVEQDKDKKQIQISASRENAVTQAIKRVYPSVVGINVKSIQKVQSRDFYDFFYGRRNRNVISQSIGSGFIITTDGYIITNQHVINKAKEISVMMPNGDNYEAVKIGEDVQTDIALIKIVNTTDKFEAVKLGNSSEIIIGEWAIALGNPFGLNQYNNNPTVTLGIISAKGRDFGHIAGEEKVYYNMLQTDAAINSGNSGGPLVNADGEVIGMNTFIYTGGNQNTGNIGIAFAIPINDIMKTVDILKSGDIDRNVDVGIYTIRNNSKQNAYYLGLSVDYGVIVLQIVRGSQAHKAGMKSGDVIIEANNFKINNYNDLKEAMFFSGLKVGDQINMKVMRGNDKLSFNLTLESQKK